MTRAPAPAPRAARAPDRSRRASAPVAAAAACLAFVLAGCEALGIGIAGNRRVFTTEPASADVLGVGDSVPFTMGHCGLSSPIDVDGSLWKPPAAALAEVSFDGAPGVFTLVEEDVATFVTDDRRVRVRLARQAGSMELPVCD